MTPTILLAAFTLITVTNQGEVFHAKGFDTLRMCEQAKSVAVYGRTIEQLEAARKAERELEAKQDAVWLAAHPPRKASANEAKGGSWTDCAGNVCKYWHVENGLTYEGRPMYISLTHQQGAHEEIKHAECVIEPPKESTR